MQPVKWKAVPLALLLTVALVLLLAGRSVLFFSGSGSSLLRAARSTPADYAGSSPFRMHGVLGLKPDGTPGFPLSPRPQPPIDMAKELRDNGFFRRLSDSISLDRNVTDPRNPQCKSIEYDLQSLPQTSVVFVFYDEAMSTLLRSVHSVLNRSPPELLKEIILVDDGSSKAWLKEPLEEYVKLLPKVRLVRQPQRSGLVRARLRGAMEATAETFTILDSHIEVSPGWLEPLMFEISKDRRNVVMPMVDGVNQETFQVQPGGIGCSLGFLWNLIEHSIPIQKQDQALRHSEVDPVRSPTMAGGLFATNREYFWEIGGYDTEMGFWGTENLEYSFRIWQCGGQLTCMPCSRVYHIFRKGGHAYTLPPGHVAKNKMRTAKVWMDEFGFIVEAALGKPKVDIGPLDNMLSLRERLHCKSFSWFLKTVYPESIITDVTDIRALGEVRNPASGMCLDTMHSGRHGQYGSYTCHGQGGSQSFMLLSRTNELRPVEDLELCLTSSLTMEPCDYRKDTVWEYNQHTLRAQKLGTCLTLEDHNGLSLQPCDGDNAARQQWTMDLRDAL
eukprot:m.84081 g.84081  ORF g.84081 m.84081 type:complete len:558 (-) comp17769_c0_seq2:57-1730(-)